MEIDREVWLFHTSSERTCSSKLKAPPDACATSPSGSIMLSTATASFFVGTWVMRWPPRVGEGSFCHLHSFAMPADMTAVMDQSVDR
jgi:hypothetical protein